MLTPNVTLTGIEYLLVCIQANPGRSQRYYLRRLYRYKHGEADPTGGSRGAGYFTSESYRGVLWYDAAPKTVEVEPFSDTSLSLLARVCT